MTPEKQRIAIAEVCGWKWTEDGWHDTVRKRAVKMIAGHNLPDYLNDLNAMHEAVMFKWDNPKFRVMYSAVLAKLCHFNDIDLCVATAA